MNNKNNRLIATIATVVLCGCPGLFGLCYGAISLFASFTPGAEIDVFGSNDPASATIMGLVTLCLSIIFIAIPIAIWYVTRPKSSPDAGVSNINEPMPPAS